VILGLFNEAVSTAEKCQKRDGKMTINGE